MSFVPYYELGARHPWEVATRPATRKTSALGCSQSQAQRISGPGRLPPRSFCCALPGAGKRQVAVPNDLSSAFRHRHVLPPSHWLAYATRALNRVKMRAF